MKKRRINQVGFFEWDVVRHSGPTYVWINGAEVYIENYAGSIFNEKRIVIEDDGTIKVTYFNESGWAQERAL